MASDVKTYRGRTLEELLPRVREELGPEAVVLRRREGLAGGIGGFFQRRFVEIEARGPEALGGGAQPSGGGSPEAGAHGGGKDAGGLVRNDRASAEGFASPAVRALVEQARPFADALARAEGGVAARADALLTAAAQGTAGSPRAETALAPDLLGALDAAPAQWAPAAREAHAPELGADLARDADPGLYGPQPRRGAPTPALEPAGAADAPPPDPVATVAPPAPGTADDVLAEAPPAAPGPGSGAEPDAVVPATVPADADAEPDAAEPATPGPADAPADAGTSAADRTGSLAEHLLAAIAASRGLAEQEATGDRPAVEPTQGTADPEPAAEPSEPEAGAEPRAAEPEPAAPVSTEPPTAPAPAPARLEPPVPAPVGARLEPSVPAPVGARPEPSAARETTADRLVPSGADGLKARIVAAGLSPALAADVVAEAVAHGMPFAARDELEAVVRLALARRIPVMGPIGTGPRCLAVVGAGGAGKSALAGHLAAAYADAGARVVLVVLRSSDGGRAQAARLEPLGVTVLAARDATEAHERLAGQGPLLTLLDTPAVSPADSAARFALAAELRALGATEIHLALPATLSGPAAEEGFEAFASLAPTCLALTHADETRRPGAPVELAIRTGRPLSYLCTRDAVAPVDRTALAEHLLP